MCQSLLRAQLGQRVNVMILEKALTLELQHFEDSEFYDKLTRARREASSRPLSLVMRTFGLVQNGISLVSYGTLLASLLAVGGGGAAAGGPAGVRRGSEVLRRCVPPVPLALARDAHADLSGDRAGARGPRQGSEAVRPRPAAAASAIATSSGALYREDRALTIRRDAWGFGLGPHRHGRAVRRVCLDRGQHRARARSRSAR